MSGFEVAGIVLGTIPLLISALEHYERGIRMIQGFRRHAKVMHILATSLSTEQTILRNTCETLLGGIINPRDMKPLLADPFGPLWQDSNTHLLVERRLDHTAEDFEILIHSMKEAVEEMRVKLGLGPSFEIRIDDRPISKIKIALQFSTHEASLRKVADINQKLHLIMTGNLRNEPYRKIHSPERFLNLLQTVSRSIFNALKTSLSCTCAPSHSVGFGLPTPKFTGRAQDEEALVRRLDFHLVLANNTQDVKGKARRTWVWNELVIRLAEVPMNVCTTATESTVPNTAEKKSRFMRVRFLNDNTDEPLMQLLSPLSGGKSKPGLSFDASHQIITKAPGPISSSQLIQVKDICRTLSGKPPHIAHQGPYGYMLDETTQKQQRFEVHPFKSSTGDEECTMIYLNRVFSQEIRPSLAQKYHIAATAASSVLFMHNTSWMPHMLTTKDVFFISRSGNVELGEIYLAKNSLHSIGGTTSASSHDLSKEATGALTLYYLGVFLLEVMLWKPVYKFWDEEGVKMEDVPLEDVLDCTTGKGFARIEAVLKRIEWISSPEFKEVVEHCIKCDLNASILSLDNDTFRQALYNEIVLPLQDADRLVGGKMSIRRGKLGQQLNV